MAAALVGRPDAASAQAQSLDPATWSNLSDASLLGVGAAPPFRLAADAPSRERALTCLASAVYYEAAGQPLQGQQAVAQVVLNRVRHIAYPKTVCGVIYEGAPRRGCQFTFACDGSLDRPPGGPGWRMAIAVAEQALDGFVEPSVGASTHYHTVFVHPVWDEEMRMVRRIGAHLFFRAPGVLGDASALTGVYEGREPDVADLVVRARSDLARPDLAPSDPTRAGRAARRAAARPAAHPAAFSIWGLQVATVRPMGDTVSVIADRPGT